LNNCQNVGFFKNRTSLNTTSYDFSFYKNSYYSTVPINLILADFSKAGIRLGIVPNQKKAKKHLVFPTYHTVFWAVKETGMLARP